MAGAASGKCRLQLQPVLGARQLPFVLSVVLAVRHALVFVIAVAVARRREAHLDLLELERRDVLEDLLREVCRREDRERASATAPAEPSSRMREKERRTAELAQDPPLLAPLLGPARHPSLALVVLVVALSRSLLGAERRKADRAERDHEEVADGLASVGRRRAAGEVVLRGAAGAGSGGGRRRRGRAGEEIRD